MPMTSNLLNLTQNFQPNNNYNLTFPGSPLANLPGFSTTLLLGPSVAPNIVQSYNKNFTSTMFLMGLPKEELPGKTDIWFEEPHLEAPVVVRSGVGASNNGGSGTVTQAIPITDASYNLVSQDHKLLYPDRVTNAVVTSVTGSAGSYVANVVSYNGQSLPALVTGDELGNSGPRNSDGQALPTSTFRSSVVQFNNWMEDLGYFAVGWDPRDSQEWDNIGTTNFKKNDMMNCTKRYFNAITQTVFMSQGGITTLQSGRQSYSTKGMFKQQSDAGVSVTDVTAGNCVDALREAVYDIVINEGGNDFVLAGAPRLLNKFGLGEKSERLRYQVGDHTYDSHLTRYEFFDGHSVTPLPIPQWENRGLYGDGMFQDLILFRRSDVKLTYMRNWPMFSTGMKLANNQNSNPVPGYANIELLFYSAFFGVRWEKAWASARFRMAA